MATGYCTLEDVRRALREKSLPGDLSQDNQIAVDGIAAQTEPVERKYKRHWYADPTDDIVDESTEIEIPQSVNTRDDEHSIPSHAGFVHGASEIDDRRYSQNSDALLEAGTRRDQRLTRVRDIKKEIRIAIGDSRAMVPPVDDSIPAYTRITLARKDVQALNELFVINADGGWDDWVADSAYDGGVGKTHRGKDYWVRINNGGVSELYLDVHSMDDEISSLANAVYVDIDYGHEGIPRHVRRAVALRAAAYFTEEATIQIPENARLYNVETKAEEMRSEAERLLEAELEFMP